MKIEAVPFVTPFWYPSYAFHEKIVSMYAVGGTVVALALVVFLMCRAFLTVRHGSFRGPEFSHWMVLDAPRDAPVTGWPDANSGSREVIREFFSEIVELTKAALALVGFLMGACILLIVHDLTDGFSLLIEDFLSRDKAQEDA